MTEDTASLTIILSLLASFCSVTYTLISVLYTDHHSETRMTDMKMQRRMLGQVSMKDKNEWKDIRGLNRKRMHPFFTFFYIFMLFLL